MTEAVNFFEISISVRTATAYGDRNATIVHWIRIGSLFFPFCQKMQVWRFRFGEVWRLVVVIIWFTWQVG